MEGARRLRLSLPTRNHACTHFIHHACSLSLSLSLSLSHPRLAAASSCQVLYGEESRYAERLPIGLEKVIRSASAEVVKGFYQKWYRPENQAIVAVGDFPDRAAVVDMLREAFGGRVLISAC